MNELRLVAMRFLFASALALAGLPLAAVPLLVSPVSAEGRVLAEYTARLGPQDHVTSSGARLDTVAAILRQDRANWHRFDQADDEDEADPVFVSAQERGRFERLVARGLTLPDTRRAIIDGEPLVRVTVYATRVDVELLSP